MGKRSRERHALNLTAGRSIVMICFENVTYTYPFSAMPAVRDINIRVRPGELVLISGQSGCGKTTLMRLANGLCPGYFKGKMKGRVLIDGQDTSTMPLGEISRRVGTLFQDPEQQFFALGVEDELAFAHEWRGLPACVTREKVRHAAATFGLSDALGKSVHELSEGQKQKVGLASLISQQPRALVLDEPTANLDPESTVELALRLRTLKESGMAVLVVDHRLYWLEGVADRVLVMKHGEICAMGGFALLEDESLRHSCGLRDCHVEDVREVLPKSETPLRTDEERGLRVENLGFGYRGQDRLFDGAELFLGPGVTALIGENGAGKTTLARLLTGLNRAEEGRFFIDGKALTPERLLSRASIVLQNADHQLHMKTVMQELDVSCRLAEGCGGELDALPGHAFSVQELLELFGLSALAKRHPQSLSGGEKQRLVIACAFAKNPDILILDEPTSGLDGGNMLRIAQALTLLAERGACVLVITHDLELMKRSCTRALRLPLRSAVGRGKRNTEEIRYDR